VTWIDRLEQRLKDAPLPPSDEARTLAMDKAVTIAAREQHSREPAPRRRVSLYGALATLGVIAATALSPAGPAVAGWVDNLVSSQDQARIAPEGVLSPSELEERSSAEADGPIGEENVIPEGAPPQVILDRCDEVLRGNPEDLTCRALRAASEGNLAPGSYSDEELEAALGE